METSIERSYNELRGLNGGYRGVNKLIDIEDIMQMPDPVLIDVRSEGEYEEATIPGAVNLSLLNNLQRALVGTTYKEQGPDAAKSLGLKLVGPGLNRYVESFRQFGSKQEVVLFCWRGGLRSKFVAELLDTMGFQIFRLKGGFKAYRRFVNSYLGRPVLPVRVIVLDGLTGVGKTDVLNELRLVSMPVLDLEGLARHRGSVYGKIGLPPSPGQKMFEALIVRDLMDAEHSGVVVVECESRRLGKLLVPQLLIQAMRQGRRVLLYAGLEQRVARIKEIYAAGGNEGIRALQEATLCLVRYLGHSKVQELNQLLEQGRLDEVFTYLLTKYYDPLYKYPSGPSPDFELCVDTTDPKQAAAIIKEYVVKLPEYQRLTCPGGDCGGNRLVIASGQRTAGAFPDGCGRANKNS